jgi:predicted PurR-regulated permease PerM
MTPQRHTVRAASQRAFVITLVVIATVAAVVAVWELHVLVALLFLGFIVAAAMRPGVEALAQHGVPRAAGVLIHRRGFENRRTG